MRNANGEGSKFKTKGGLYGFRCFVKMADGSRKRIEATSKNSYKQAKEKCLDKKAVIENEVRLEKSDYKKLATWADKWLSTIVKTGNKQTTYETYSFFVKTYLIPEFGDRLMDEISGVELQSFFNALLKRGLSASTVHALRRCTRTMFYAAMRVELIGKNPVVKTKAPRIEKKDYKVLSASEAKTLIAMAGTTDSAYYRKMSPVLYTLAIKTGMRRGELFGLMWEDIDFDHCCIHVSHNLSNGRNSNPYIGTPKTKTSCREIMIDAGDVTMLKKWHEEHEEHKKVLGSTYKGCEYDVVFPTLRGTLVRYTTFTRRHFRPLCDKAGLPKGFRFHDLRHTCATLLLKANQHPKIVQERLGHSSISVTMDRYSQYIPSMQKDAVQALSSILG